ncbi:MAG: phosphoglucosamine mutase [Acidimicrobiales bacterium]|nr:phosphoglucosamine mutase [Acidimicrobiales bacterium]|tara:strand:- start:12866 stop:14185 length:1320 start_codon:yes stop_codon:yes gene_type:complete
MALVFGTDGVRGHVGSEIDEEKIVSLGIAASRHLNTKRVYLGRDTRESSFVLAAALKQGLHHGGVEVISLGIAPTPEVAHVAKVENAGGAVISASHNSWFDNGVKLFGPGGLKISDSVQDLIQIDWDKEQNERHVVGIPDLEDQNDSRWVNSIISSAEQDCFSGLKLVLDCANGATVNKAAIVFKELGATVVEVSSNPDGRNINDNCGSNNPQNLIKEVLSSDSDIGFAFDGDGDRVVAVTSDGSILDGDHLLVICATDRFKRGLLKGSSVVITPMANLGMRNALSDIGILLHEVPVGDRNILEALEKSDWVLGGEQSGHIIFRDLSTTGDGVLTGVQALLALNRKGKMLTNSKTIFSKVPQVLINVPVGSNAEEIVQEITDEVNVASMELGDGGRILVRPSGTEPLVRVMVETLDPALANRIAEHLSNLVVRKDQRFF